MAEELTLGHTRAHDGDDDEPSKEELQRRMEEARETITQTVTEIKETVTNQYYSMKETVSEALDWRHHFRRNPIAFSVGALSVGFLVGYGLTGALKGSGSERDEDYPSSEETDVYARMNATPSRYDEGDDVERRSAFHGHSYAAQPITDQLDESSDDARTDERAAAGGSSPSYSAPRADERADTPQKPGLYERFKETSAYDRLQTEVSTLGERFMEELSSTAQNVVLPALFNKIKEMFGVDLSNKQGQQQSQGGNQPAQSGDDSTSQSNTGARAASASASGASGSLASASRGSSDASYATSENRGYGAQGTTSDADRSGEGSSVLDLDR
jgi:hypothetical protein